MPATRSTAASTDQDRSRAHNAAHRRMARVTAQGCYRRLSRSAVTCSTASRTRRALRASLLGQLGGGFSLAGSYAEGIAQPTFFDLYGFFPGQFRGQSEA